MNKSLAAACACALISLALTGCAREYPGHFSQVDSDLPSQSLQFRYKPSELNAAALNSTIAAYCHQRGFDKVEPLPEQQSAWPGYKTRWFQCNYSVTD